MGQLLGPSAYLSQADSPINPTGFSYFFLEDFEDSLINTPGIVLSAGFVTTPNAQTDSVDGDDGAIDGSGNAGHSLLISTASQLTVTFDQVVLGGFPTHAGLVWTDVGTTASGVGVDDVSFEAFDAGGVSLGVIGPVTLGDGNASGGTAEDRFFGVIHAGGVSAITMTLANSQDWEIDHLQYGLIPEPTTSLLLLLAAGMLVVRRR